MYSPFKYIKCFIDNSGYKVILWSFNKNLEYRTDMQLVLECSNTGNQWYTISQDLLQQCCFIDRRKLSTNKEQQIYYRLKLKSQFQQYISQTCRAGSRLVYPHYPRAKNLIRLAAKQMAKTGMHGVLLKKKTFGQSCPVCKDFHDDFSVNQHCSQCFGTGIVGGYYKGIPMDILPQQTQQVVGITDDGVVQNKTLKCRCIAWPYLQHGDIWVDAVTNNRYYIDQINVASSYMHVPIIAFISMHLIEFTDVVYKQSKQPKPVCQDINIDWLQDFKVK